MPPPDGRGVRRSTSRVVTPEAVALDLQTATVATRGLAAILDLVVQGLALVLVTVAITVADVDDVSGTVAVVFVLVAVFVLRVGYPVILETRFGATLGHLALGLRVVTLDGAPIRVRQAIARAAVGMFEIDMTLGSLALIVAASREDGRRLGDLAAGTQVVSTRVGTGPAAAVDVQVPARLQDWAAALDTTAVLQPERAALRRYVTRAPDLAVDRRDALAGDLADRLLRRMAAQRPPDATAHDTLLAIAATLAERARTESGAAPTIRLPMQPPPAPPSATEFEPPR